MNQRMRPKLKPTRQSVKQQKQNVLQTAEAVIYGDREQTYGDPGKNLQTIASYWSVHLHAKFGVILDLTPDDVCGMMILLKQARLATTPTHKDSLVDVCGYAALQERVQEYEKD